MSWKPFVAGSPTSASTSQRRLMTLSGKPGNGPGYPLPAYSSAKGFNAQPRLPRATAAAGPLRRGPSICCSRSIGSTGSHRPCAPKYSGSIQTAIGGSEGTSILMSRRRGHERLGRPSRTLQIAFHIEQLCERPLVNGAGSHEVHCPEM